MAVIACVLDDSDLRARLVRIVGMRAGATILESECDPPSIHGSLSGRQVDAAVVGSVAFTRFLEVREAIYEHGPTDKKVTIIVVAQNVDSAFVYRARSFGADDVIDMGQDDDHVAGAIEIALLGSRRAYELYLVGEVDEQIDITSLRIDYADEVDRQIVPMIVAGYTDREIADVLHYSHQAVRNRISRLLMRSGIRNRTQLASTFLVGRLSIALSQEPEGEVQP
jgi:DNA-binding NarL/FixJ family response regulator